ncbi:histone deacetylase family protein [Salinimonas sediminis]|uniref:Histone deacetylase family protein n=1 Tax=Salinimonas sediminis TaxID=2303538 RepID=A0A346NRL5_9ALTE|nr:histone deacetylase family protein [Salinimonas sediminis]AXR08172.1 histone deacetylase family protein [Salinimonas sediminis]
MTVRIYRGRDCTLHDLGAAHPESPDRLYAINDQLIASGLEMTCEHADAKPVAKQQLYLAHDKTYIDNLFARTPTDTVEWLDDETGMMSSTLSAISYAAGAVCDAVDWVMAGQDRQAFCMVRPPGHHAEKNQAMGFCFINNVALAARYALTHYPLQLQRVAIVDFDVHHGNGTEHIIEGDERILLCSSFEHPLYPYRDNDKASPNTVAIPLPPGATGEQFRQAIEGWFRAIREFQPGLIIVSAGFDGHAEDPMAHLRLTEDDYKWVSHALRRLADECCDGRIVSSLEGGYDLSALGRSVVAHLKGLGGDANETGGA